MTPATHAAQCTHCDTTNDVSQGKTVRHVLTIDCTGRREKGVSWQMEGGREQGERRERGKEKEREREREGRRGKERERGKKGREREGGIERERGREGRKDGKRGKKRERERRLTRCKLKPMLA